MKLRASVDQFRDLIQSYGISDLSQQVLVDSVQVFDSASPGDGFEKLQGSLSAQDGDVVADMAYRPFELLVQADGRHKSPLGMGFSCCLHDLPSERVPLDRR